MLPRRLRWLDALLVTVEFREQPHTPYVHLYSTSQNKCTVITLHYSYTTVRKCIYNCSLSKISAKGIVFTCSYAVVISKDNRTFIPHLLLSGIECISMAIRNLL